MSRGLIRYFPETHMGLGHQGLTELAKTRGIDPGKLNSGEYVIFTNKKKTAVKIYAPGQVIAYKKYPKGIDLRIIQEIPRSFAGGKLNFDAALKSALVKSLEGKK